MRDLAAQVELQPVTLGDLDCLAAMRQELYAHDPTAIHASRDRETLWQLINQPALGRAWLAISRGQCIGYLIITFCFSIEFGGRFALIDELFLAAEWRSRGLGSELLELLEHHLRGEGIGAIRLEVERSNVGAERLYRRQGFEPHDRHLMTKWLDRG